MTKINIGDDIHLKPRRGVYRVVALDNEHIHVTCNKWIYEHQQGERASSVVCYQYSDYNGHQGKPGAKKVKRKYTGC